MTGREVLFYTPHDKLKLEAALQESLRNIIVSLPFASNYHSFKNKNGLINSLFLESVPTVLFHLFADEQNLKIEINQTSFWCKSLYDFSYEKTAFKFIHQRVKSENILPAESYLTLPALVPNRFEGDVWDKLKDIPNGMDKNVVVFTFLMNSKNNCIADFSLSTDILNFLQNVVKKYGHWKAEEEPFSQDDFWDALAKKGELPHISINHLPTLIIAGVAGEKEYKFFADTDDKTNHGYRLYQGRWYEIEKGGGLSFCNGLVKSSIKNATCPMEALPSFDSLKEGLK